MSDIVLVEGTTLC